MINCIRVVFLVGVYGIGFFFFIGVVFLGFIGEILCVFFNRDKVVCV